MFDLEQAISSWRRQMAVGGIESGQVLDELEGHLRDDVEQKVRSGLPEQEAFLVAIQQIGGIDALKPEFDLAGATVGERLKQVILTLAGIPNSELVTNVNSHHSTNLEPRWATYLKAGTFAMPAVLLWMFSMVFLVPKLQDICQHEGTSFFVFEGAPAVFRASAFVGRTLFLVAEHWLLTASAILLVFILLEWRSSWWPRYRKAVLGAGTFLLNLLVLVSITLMVVAAIIATSNLPHAK